MLKAPSSEGLVPALVSSFFCLFPLHSHHVAGRQRAIVESGELSSVCHCVSIPQSHVPCL